MRRVSFRVVAAMLLVLVLATPAMANSGGDDPGLWAQFVAWINAWIGVPTGATTTSDSFSFEEWLVLMARIGIPGG